MSTERASGNTAGDSIIEGLLAAILDNIDTAATVYPLLDPNEQDDIRAAAAKLYNATHAAPTADGQALKR